MTQTNPADGAFRDIPYMGVIWVVAEAMKLGFWNGNPDWCNLGQGQPEVGEMEGAPPRLDQVAIQAGDHAYGHINGIDEMRDAVAAHYNRLYRQGMASQYTRANVSIAAGGRLMLSRVFATLGEGRVGYQTPDYTAYEDMLDYHRYRFAPVHIAAREEDGFMVPAAELERRMQVDDLTAFVVSNPCNPTGRVVQGDELVGYIAAARKHGCALILDEFYSHFIYGPEGGPGDAPVSGAPLIDDVNTDPVVLVDGLTKCYRYPGWRVGWAVGPAHWVEKFGRAASAIDGGLSIPAQRAALEVLEPSRADQETDALRQVFGAKRDLMVERLKAMGIRPAVDSEATFYVWASLADLPAPLNDADVFFKEALKYKVMTVPGRFFDVNPGGVRGGESPFKQWMRFSFGPPIDNVRLGLDRLDAMLAAAREATPA